MAFSDQHTNYHHNINALVPENRCFRLILSFRTITVSTNVKQKLCSLLLRVVDFHPYSSTLNQWIRWNHTFNQEVKFSINAIYLYAILHFNVYAHIYIYGDCIFAKISHSFVTIFPSSSSSIYYAYLETYLFASGWMCILVYQANNI